MRLLRVVVVFIILALVPLIPPHVPVYAATPLPDSDPTLTNISIFRHLLETDDLLVVATYNLPYATTPNASASQAFTFRFLHTDGSTQFGANDVCSFNDDGYGYGVIAWYFSAAMAPTWGLNYILQIAGKPTEFASIPSWNYPINAADYSTQTDQSGNQQALAADILIIAQDLQNQWSETLLDTGDSGTILGTNGELYFRTAIPGIQSMAPALFMLQIEDPDYASANWSTSQATTYAGRYTGTWIGDAIQTIADLFSMDFHFIASIPILILAVLCIVAGAAMNNIYSGMLGAIAVILYGCVQGWTPMAIMGIGSILAAAYLAYHWFLRGAQ